MIKRKVEKWNELYYIVFMSMNPEVAPVPIGRDLPFTLNPELGGFIAEQLVNTTIKTEAGTVTLQRRLQEDLGDLYSWYERVLLVRAAYVDQYNTGEPYSVLKKNRVKLKGVVNDAEAHGLSPDLISQAYVRGEEMRRAWKEKQQAGELMKKVGSADPHMSFGDSDHRKGLGYVQGQRKD